LTKPRPKCNVCGARLTASEYIGRSMDLSTCFYRCRRCGTIVAIKVEED